MYEWYFTMTLFMTTLILLWEILLIVYGYKFLSFFKLSSLWKFMLDEKQDTNSHANTSTIQDTEEEDFIPDTSFKERTRTNTTPTTLTAGEEDNEEEEDKMDSQWTRLFESSQEKEKSLHRMSSYQYDIPPNMNPYSYTYIPEFTESQYIQDMEYVQKNVNATDLQHLDEFASSDGLYSVGYPSLELSHHVNTWRQNVDSQDCVISSSEQNSPNQSHQDVLLKSINPSGLTRRHSFLASQSDMDTFL